MDTFAELSPVIKISSTTAKGGALTAASSGGIGLTGWLAENYDWLAGLGVCVGIFVGLAGLAVNIYYQHKRMKLLEDERK